MLAFATAVADHGWRPTGSWFGLICQRRRFPGAGNLRFRSPPLRDVRRQPIDTCGLSRRIEVRNCNLLQPDFAASIRPQEPERRRIRALVRTGVQMICDRRPIIRMDMSHQFRAAEGRFGPIPRISVAFALSCIRPVRRSQSKAITPPARSASSNRRSLSRISSSCIRRSLKSAPGRSAPERVGQGARLSGQDTLIERQPCIAERPTAISSSTRS